MITYEELMMGAPKDCRPTVISEKSIIAETAKRLNKKPKDLTEEEKKAGIEDWETACMTDYDLMTM